MTINKLSISNLPSVYFDGCYRVLGLIPSSEESKAGFQSFSSAIRSLAPSEWREIDMSHFDNTIWDQQMTSSCVGQSTTAGIQSARIQGGASYTELNPYFTYGLINGGRDAGAMISHALTALTQYGTCLKEDLSPGMMYQNQFPQIAFEHAKQNRLIQALRCDSFEEICSALSLGFFTPLGIMVGQNFANLDSEGVAPLPAGGGGGHAILGCGLKKSSRYGWLIKIKNSWSARFGLNGYCYLRKEHFRSMNPDAFAIQSVTLPSDNLPIVQNLSFSKGAFMSEDIKLAATNFGFDGSWIAEIVAKYGNDVASLIIEAARNGLTVSFVVEIIQKFGPTLLQLIVDLLNKNNSTAFAATCNKTCGVTSDVFPPVMEGVDSPIVSVLLDKFLPVIMEKFGPVIMQLITEQLMKLLQDNQGNLTKIIMDAILKALQKN